MKFNRELRDITKPKDRSPYQYLFYHVVKFQNYLSSLHPLHSFKQFLKFPTLKIFIHYIFFMINGVNITCSLIPS